MRIKYIILMFAVLLAFSSCGEKKKKSYDEIAMSGLTTRTENLKTNIKAYANKGTVTITRLSQPTSTQKSISARLPRRDSGIRMANG